MRARSWIVTCAVLGAIAAPGTADAFCGFYVSGADASLYNDATQVVLMRAGTRTVLSMQNRYQGPPSDFAMVVPVPVVLKEANVKTLPAELFARIDKLSAPRLVEYWEEDPCAPRREYDIMRKGMAPTTGAPAPTGARDHGVKIEAQFKVGEYEVVVLSATESTGLDRWLRDNKYKIPAGAEPYLKPYVAAGSKFFVAKVDVEKVKFVDGKATLSPLRFHYDTEAFALPIRLGMMNSSGTQDLIVNILAPGQRYEVANYPNVTIATNLDLRDEAKGRFGEFYAALFDRTLEKTRGAVVTEYAWDASSCDPCPEPALDPNELQTLGADVLGAEVASGVVLTRLHARYGKDAIGEDLVFRAAPPIAGGRELMQANGKLEEGSRPHSMNQFQGRYAIRHPWLGPVACKEPRRGIWGGPPDGGARPMQAATDLASVARGEITLASMVAAGVPELGLEAGMPSAATTSATPAPADDGSAPRHPVKRTSGCAAAGGSSGWSALALLGLGLALATRRPRGRG